MKERDVHTHTHWVKNDWDKDKKSFQRVMSSKKYEKLLNSKYKYHVLYKIKYQITVKDFWKWKGQ